MGAQGNDFQPRVVIGAIEPQNASADVELLPIGFVTTAQSPHLTLEAGQALRAGVADQIQLSGEAGVQAFALQLKVRSQVECDAHIGYAKPVCFGWFGKAC